MKNRRGLLRRRRVGVGAALDLVQVRLCGLGPTETTLAEIQDSLRVLPTTEGRWGRRHWPAAKEGVRGGGTLLPSLGCLGPLPLTLLHPTLIEGRVDGMSLRHLCPSQALTGHKVTGISQQRAACGNHIRAALSPLLELGLGKALQLGELGSSPFANRKSLSAEAKAKAKSMCWVSKGRGERRGRAGGVSDFWHPCS